MRDVLAVPDFLAVRLLDHSGVVEAPRLLNVRRVQVGSHKPILLQAQRGRPPMTLAHRSGFSSANAAGDYAGRLVASDLPFSLSISSATFSTSERTYSLARWTGRFWVAACVPVRSRAKRPLTVRRAWIHYPPTYFSQAVDWKSTSDGLAKSLPFGEVQRDDAAEAAVCQAPWVSELLAADPAYRSTQKLAACRSPSSVHRSVRVGSFARDSRGPGRAHSAAATAAASRAPLTQSMAVPAGPSIVP